VEDKVPAPQSRLLWHSAPLSNTRAQLSTCACTSMVPLAARTTCDYRVLRSDLIR
jgi:hypothetical protein